MTDRLFVLNGYLYTVLLATGLVAQSLSPDSGWALVPLHAGLLLLMVTPVSRVAVACLRYVRAGERGAAALTAAILVVIAISAWAGAR